MNYASRKRLVGHKTRKTEEKVAKASSLAQGADRPQSQNKAPELYRLRVFLTANHSHGNTEFALWCVAPSAHLLSRLDAGTALISKTGNHPASFDAKKEEEEEGGRIQEQ